MNKFRRLHLAIFADERSIHTRRWVLGLRECGHNVNLITLRKDNSNDIGAISLDAKSKIDYLTKIYALKKIVKNLEPDIFHAHYASSFGFLASFIDHPRKILSVWGDDVIIFPHRNLLFKQMMKRTLRSSNHITTTSQFLKKVVLNFNGKHPQISVIPFGVDTAMFGFAERIPAAEVKIGITKHLDQIYGVDTLIKAFDSLVKIHDNIQLIIAGDGPLRDEYQKLVKNLGLKDKVKFIGHIDHSQMPQLLNSIDIAVMPSRSEVESFGVAALEASATGLPVVGTKVGGIPEVIIDGVTGFLVERENVAQLANILTKLIKDPMLRRQIGIAGRQMVENRYPWHQSLLMMQNLYFEIMAT
jgi:L-malate glycosyltransferase